MSATDIPSTRTAWQSIRLNLLYARRLFWSLAPSLAVTLAMFSLGTVVLHTYYQGGIPLHEAIQIMYFLMLAEPTHGAMPDNMLVEAVVFIAPLVGIMVVFDLLARFSLHVFSKKTNQREWVNLVASTYKDHIVLCGLGRVGRKVFRELVDLGENVVCVEQHEEAVGVRVARMSDHPVIIDDARIDRVLIQTGIERAKAVLAVTDDDMCNLEIALDARKYNEKIRIIARIHDEKLGRKLTSGLRIDGVYSTTSIAAPFFAVSGLDPEIINSYFLHETRYVVVETKVRAGGWLDGITVAEALDRHGMTVIACGRTEDGKRLAPVSTGQTLEAGDEVCYQAPYETFKRWRRARNQTAR